MSGYQLPHNEWVVIFYPQTGSTRLCPSLDFARNFLTSAASMSNVYRSPADFRSRHDHHSLEKFWLVARKSAAFHLPKTASGNLDDHPVEPPDVDTETFCKLLWQLLQDIGDRLETPIIRTEKTKEHYEFKLQLMRDLVEDPQAFKELYNNQARTVFTALLDSGRQFMSEEEIKRLIFGLVGDRKLKTRQKPWVIFQYYRPEFIKNGHVIRGRAPKSSDR